MHTYIGDLVVSLIAPDGTAYVLHNRAGGSTDNINQTYTVNLSAETANGTWTLRVQDAAAVTPAASTPGRSPCNRFARGGGSAPPPRHAGGALPL